MSIHAIVEHMSKRTDGYYKIDKVDTTDVWLTPQSLLDKLGHFDLDPCSPKEMPYKIADRFYSLENNEDGLMLPWEGRVWLNPPYSNWVPFMKRLKEHNNGLALIFARTETQGFFDHIWNDANSILFLKRRLKFSRLDGSLGGGSTTPSVLIAYGENNSEILENCGLDGKHVFLK